MKHAPSKNTLRNHEANETLNPNEYGSVLDARGAMPNAPTTPNNVGVILLSREESLLFNK
jgi:hypothetical protein